MILSSHTLSKGLRQGFAEGTKAFAQALSGETTAVKRAGILYLTGFIIFIIIAAYVTCLSARRFPGGPGPRGPLEPGGTVRRPHTPHPMPPIFRVLKAAAEAFEVSAGGSGGGEEQVVSFSTSLRGGKNVKRSWIIVIGIILVLALGLISQYNRLVSLETNIDGRWAQVENQLQRRADLIPNLVNTVRG